MIDLLREEFRRCMALCGCKSVSDINRSCLARLNADGVLATLKGNARSGVASSCPNRFTRAHCCAHVCCVNEKRASLQHFLVTGIVERG